MPDKTINNWVNRYKMLQDDRDNQDAIASENRRLAAALQRMTEERDILKKATVGSAANFSRESVESMPLSRPADMPGLISLSQTESAVMNN
jgi:transposase-like protein